MQNLNMIIGRPHEGKTNELIKRYVDFCKGTTIIDGTPVKNIEISKPVFIYIQETKENLIERIRDLEYYEAHENLFINLNGEEDKILNLWVEEINGNLQDVTLFMDINIPFENVSKYIAALSNDIIPAMSKNIVIDINMTVLDMSYRHV